MKYKNILFEKNKLHKGDRYLTEVCLCLFLSFIYLFEYTHAEEVSIILFSLFFLIEYLRKSDINFILLKALTVSLPISFYPLTENYISVFIIIQILLCLNIFGKKIRGGIILVLLLIICCLSISSFLFHQSLYHTIEIEVFIKLMLFLVSLLSVYKSINLSKIQILYLIKLFILTAGVAGIAVLGQIILRICGIVYVGYQSMQIEKIGQQPMEGVRIGFCGLFKDCSLISVYLAATGGSLLISFLKKQYIFGKLTDCFFALFFIITSILTTARSGIMAFFLTMIVFFFVEKRRILLVALCWILPLFYFTFELLASMRGDLLSDNGRYDNFMRAINFIVKNPIWGSGILGFVALSRLPGAGCIVPHNFILEFLADFGIIISLLLTIVLIMILLNGMKNVQFCFYLLLSFCFGALFHSSFINTHYIMIPLFLISAYDTKRRYLEPIKNI
jgi:hypothetical protein